MVLSDKYGRSSSTILSIVNDGDIGGASGSFGGSTYYHPYKDSTDNVPATWPGDALKVLFNSIIPNNPADLQTGWPGLYNGTSNSSNYNPLGWYSYKIVVKQTEQDYYNVYLPGILNEDPGGSLGDPKNTIAYITLLNDNINKVPRDLNEVGPNQKQYRSSVQLFGRVTPDNILAGGPTFNEQYYPGRESHTVSTLGEKNDLLDTTTNYVDIYQSASNPSLARLTQSNLANPIGANVHSGGNYNILLGIYETNPEESRLDIFWETSTTGLIADLNDAIANGTDQATGLDGWNFSQSEADPIGTAVTGNFAPLDITNQPILSSVVTLNSVVDGTGTPRSGWELVEVPGAPNRWYLRTTNNFYFGVNGSTKESYTFTLGVIGGGITSTITATGSLTNAAPTITNCEPSVVVQQGETAVTTFTGENGSIAAGGKQTENLSWEIVSTTPPLATLVIDANTGVMTESTGEAVGRVNAVIKLSDGGGLSTTCNTSIVFGEEPANCGFNKKIKAYVPSRIGISNQAYGIYWVANKINSSANEPISRNQGNLNLQLDNDLAEGWKQTTFTGPSNCTNIGGDSEGQMTNSNFNSKSKTGCDQEDSNLSAGTGFISVNFIVNQYSFDLQHRLDTLNLKWPAYLQYRSAADSLAGNDNWVQAVDVEGLPIQFGGQQKSDYPAIQSNNTNSVNNKGVLLNPSDTSSLTFRGTPQYVANTLFSADVANVFLQSKANPSNSTLSAVANRTFAIGKDQGYESTPDKFGDYRLIVGFPYGTASNGSVISVPITITGTIVNQGVCPPEGTIYNSSEGFAGKFQTQITFGDFYYPSAYGTASTFSYWISNGQSDRTTAQNTQPIATEVYAREWHFKYITQLYKDPNLTIPLTTANGLNQTAGGFHSYCAATDGSINSEYGNSNSHTNGIGQTTTSTYTDQDRRWTAQFDSNGKKIKQTAQPNRKNQ